MAAERTILKVETLSVPFDLQLFAEDPPPGDPPPGDPPPANPEDGLTPEELAAKKSNEKVFERQRNEAKKNRERAEAAEKEREDLKKWRSEREAKDLEEQGKLRELADKREQERLAAIKERDDERAARTTDTIRERVRVQAIKRGIIDEDLVDTFDISSLKLEDGRVSGIKELLDSIAEAKPVYFKAIDAPRPGAPLDRPNPTPNGNPTDAQNLSDKDFAALDARMKSLKA
jgi:hypothetical protein